MKIIVVTLEFGGLSYFPLTRKINEAYCKAHGYDFFVTTAEEVLVDRDRIWFKVLRCHELLPACDYLFFIDADAFFNKDISIESVIEEHMGDSDIMFSNNWPWNEWEANTGTFIVKNSVLSDQILGDWWNVPFSCPKYKYHWPPEQQALNDVVMKKHDIKIVGANVINGRFSQNFIRHAAGFERKEETLRQWISVAGGS